MPVTSGNRGLILEGSKVNDVQSTLGAAAFKHWLEGRVVRHSVESQQVGLTQTSP